MKRSHGLLHRSVSVILIISLWLPSSLSLAQQPAPPTQTTPAAVAPVAEVKKNDGGDPEKPLEPIFAPEPPVLQPDTTKGRFAPAEQATLNADKPQLSARQDEDMMARALRIAGETVKDPKSRYWLIGNSLVFTAGAYLAGWRSYSLNNQRVLNMFKEGRDTALYYSVQKQSEKLGKEIRRKLFQMKKEEALSVLAVMDEAEKGQFLKQLQQRRILLDSVGYNLEGEWTMWPDADKATVTLDELSNDLAKYAELTETESGILKRLAKKAEIEMGLPEGKFTSQISDASKLKMQIEGMTDAVPNRALWAEEQARLIGDMEAQVTKARPWSARVLTRADLYPVRGVPWFRRPFSGPNKIRSLGMRTFRAAAPAVLITGGLFGYLFAQRMLIDKPVELQTSLEAADKSTGQNVTQATLETFLLPSEAIALAVEIQWADLRLKYKDHFKLPSPISVRNESSVQMVDQAHRYAITEHLRKMDNPTEKNLKDPDEEEAEKRLIETSKNLGVPLPPPDKDLSVRYWRYFWMALFEMLKASPVYGAEISAIPPVRDRDREILNPESRVATLDSIINLLAIDTNAAMVKASFMHDKFTEFLRLLPLMEETKRKEFLKNLKAVEDEKSADMATYLEYSIETYEKMKKAGLIAPDEHPLDLKDKKEKEELEAALKEQADTAAAEAKAAAEKAAADKAAADLKAANEAAAAPAQAAPATRPGNAPSGRPMPQK